MIQFNFYDLSMVFFTCI